MKRAVFLDRDGTINEMVYDTNHGVIDSPRRADQVVLLPGAAAFIKGVQALGCLVVVVTNQPGVAKGTMTMEDLHAVNDRIAELLKVDGAKWNDLYCSPYHPDGGPFAVKEFVRNTNCRKPKPGMLLEAAAKHQIDLKESWMVGDGLTDVQAGRAAGCKTILLAKPKIDIIEKFLSLENAQPDFFVANLPEALQVIRSASPSS